MAKDDEKKKNARERIAEIRKNREKRLRDNRNRDKKKLADEKRNRKRSPLVAARLEREKTTMKISKEIYNIINPKEIKGNFLEYRKRVDQAVKSYKQMSISSIKDDKLNFEKSGGFVPGGVYMYFYDPKYVERLEVYDPNPVIIYISEGSKTGNIFGLNMRYLNATTRKKLLTQFVENRTSLKEGDEFRLDTEVFEKARKNRNLKIMFREYIMSSPHLVGEVKRISAKGFENLIDLPNTIIPGLKNF